MAKPDICWMLRRAMKAVPNSADPIIKFFAAALSLVLKSRSRGGIGEQAR